MVDLLLEQLQRRFVQQPNDKDDNDGTTENDNDGSSTIEYYDDFAHALLGSDDANDDTNDDDSALQILSRRLTELQLR